METYRQTISPDGLLGRICLAVAPTELKILCSCRINKTACILQQIWRKLTKESATENATARRLFLKPCSYPTDAKRIYRPHLICQLVLTVENHYRPNLKRDGSHASSCD